MTPTESARLAAALAAQLGARLIETHISWVLLTADTAFKLKKPVHLPFVDYASLQARRRCCEEELRLNRRLAPDLYLAVEPIAGSPDAPVLGGVGEPIDYAVRMRRFPDGALFSERLPAGSLAPADVDALAALLANFHAGAPRGGASQGFGTPQRRRDVALAATRDETIRSWLQAEADRLEPLWQRRLDEGRVREVHGDLHLSNLVLLPTGVAAFDGIEFDPALRWIDVLDDLAFAVMDFAAHGSRAFAFRLLNGWLDRSGDHGALPGLRFACVYRALVRVLAHALRGDEAGAARYRQAAHGWMRPGRPQLCITHGLPGSGKTWRSQQWLEAHGAVRIRSDVERKRLHGLGLLADSRAAGLDLYTRAVTAQTYERLLELARAALAEGYPVVLDAAFLRRAERDAARALAAQRQVPFSILDCAAPPEVLRERLRARQGDASEADERVLDKLLDSAEPLGPDERA